MKNTVFENLIERRLGNYKLLPKYPFNEKIPYAIFAGGSDNFIDKATYEYLFELNIAYGNSQLIAKPHFSNSDDKEFSLCQSESDWKAFAKIQAEHMSCEGIYLCGNNYDWLGIYHYDDYLLVGGPIGFVEKLCMKMIGDLNWKEKFIDSFENGNLSMYKSDFDSLVKELF